MFYPYFELTESDKELRAKRSSIPSSIHALQKEMTAATTEEERAEINEKFAALKREATPDVLNSICGHKEVLFLILGMSPHLKSADDMMKYSRVDRLLQDAKDPCYVAIEDDLYTWIKHMITHDRYNLTVKDANGNDVQAFPNQLKMMIGAFLNAFNKAETKMPEEYKRLELLKIEEMPLENK